jgi:hypothetical protein
MLHDNHHKVVALMPRVYILQDLPESPGCSCVFCLSIYGL